MPVQPVRRALISVADKEGIVPFAQTLVRLGVELLSTGGTARLLTEAHLPVTDVSSYTGFPEIMGGRVKTLHPKLHGGILARRQQDQQVMEQHHILPIDLVVVNLYPFAKTVADPACTLAEAVEQIDIGGPAMLRAAAKNFHEVAVIVQQSDYAVVTAELESHHGGLTSATRLTLALKAFVYTAHYDGMIACYLAKQIANKQDNDHSSSSPFPNVLNLQLSKQQDLRYGENSHQQAAFYIDPVMPADSIANAQQLQGKALSYNNIADSDTALECVKSFTAPACVIVKHANPCGVAIGENSLIAWQRAYQTDPTSAFGGIIAFNCPLDAATAKEIISHQFVEVIIAPSITAEALHCLAQKPNIRVLSYRLQKSQDLQEKTDSPIPGWDYKRINGGLLVQERDLIENNENNLQIVSQRAPTSAEINDALFCCAVAKFVKSNAIVYVKAGQTLGIGAGQMSRVYSARIAAIKAAEQGLDITGAVMASDAFFPFRDSVDLAAEMGIGCIIQPGGSLRDDEVIAAADQHNITMIFTGIRHFRH